MLALVQDGCFDDLLAALPLGLVLRQEYHAHGVAVALGQVEAECLGLFLEEAVGHLEENAAAVARLGVAAARAAMGEVNQHLEAVLDQLVAAPAVDIAQKPDPAGVVFIRWIVQSLA